MHLCTLRGLEIELQSQLSVKAALKGTLVETEARFGAQLAQIQLLISIIKAQLSDIRADSECENLSQQLMDIKTRLEQEVTTYHSLLKGQDAYYEQPAHHRDCLSSEPPGLPPFSRGMHTPG